MSGDEQSFLSTARPDVLLSIAGIAATDDVTFFVGAGVSQSSGVPAWRALVECLLREAPDGPAPALSDALVSRYGMPFAASVAEQILRGQHSGPLGLERALRERLTECLYPATSSHSPGLLSESLGMVAVALAKVRPAVGGASRGRVAVITTNFDDLLDRVEVAGKQVFVPVVGRHGRLSTLSQLHRFSGAPEIVHIDEAEPEAEMQLWGHVSPRIPVFHLHGLAAQDRQHAQLHDFSDIVIAEDHFALAEERGGWLYTLCLDRLASTTCVFVGCSFNDPNMIQMLARAKAKREELSTQEGTELLDLTEQHKLDKQKAIAHRLNTSGQIHHVALLPRSDIADDHAFKQALQLSVQDPRPTGGAVRDATPTDDWTEPRATTRERILDALEGAHTERLRYYAPELEAFVRHRLAALGVGVIWADYYCEVPQFLREVMLFHDFYQSLDGDQKRSLDAPAPADDQVRELRDRYYNAHGFGHRAREWRTDLLESYEIESPAQTDEHDFGSITTEKSDDPTEDRFMQGQLLLRDALKALLDDFVLTLELPDVVSNDGENRVTLARWAEERALGQVGGGTATGTDRTQWGRSHETREPPPERLAVHLWVLRPGRRPQSTAMARPRQRGMRPQLELWCSTTVLYDDPLMLIRHDLDDDATVVRAFTSGSAVSERMRGDQRWRGMLCVPIRLWSEAVGLAVAGVICLSTNRPDSLLISRSKDAIKAYTTIEDDLISQLEFVGANLLLPGGIRDFSGAFL